jgi:hypothetical protein
MEKCKQQRVHMGGQAGRARLPFSARPVSLCVGRPFLL